MFSYFLLFIQITGLKGRRCVSVSISDTLEKLAKVQAKVVKLRKERQFWKELLIKLQKNLRNTNSILKVILSLCLFA